MTSTHAPVGRGTRVFNDAVRRLTDLGVNMAGAQTLTVRGRHSGAPHRIPVNPLVLDGRTYLVAPRGVTDWVRNARVDPHAELRRGRRIRRVVLTEPGDDEVHVAVVRRYLAKWGWEVGRLLPEGLTPDADDATLHRYRDALPVFEVHPA
ncbi:MAG: nitroreductase/quinone reductase family protein [Gordonia sp. (in: high G+C Gram-positive bacteria)]|uniref:nitroreductase/quinone reductase family protein n=1 Tax=Gordonia sp. (in: high G+C Gram-positive bacteria) TaxID=84139 RepID=UPI0039E35603